MVFPKKCAPYAVEEQLPRHQEPLELALGEKFLGALARFEGIELTRSAHRTEPADLSCHAADGTKIDIQIVEVVDRQLRAVSRMRSSYAMAIEHSLGDQLNVFRGCRVSLVDSGDPPYLPAVRSKAGEQCVSSLAEHIRNVGAEIGTLAVGSIRSRKTKVGTIGRSVGVLVERFLPFQEGAPLDFLWTGGGPAFRTDISRGLLTAAIRSKMHKRYAKPTSAKFWLLAYSIDILLHEADLDVTESRDELSNREHPFDAVWFLFPYASKPLGALLRIWANNDG